jgi:hypothetical protein
MPFTLLSASSISGGVGDSLRPNAKSLVFNGNMAISQRGTSFTGKTGVDYYACDRWRTFIDSLGTHTITQEDSNNPTGFEKSYKILTTTANASPSGTNYLYLRQSLEGNDVQLLKYGTSDAVKLTAGFWVKSNKTGTFGVETQCLSGGTSYERTEDITINSADTWEFKTFVVPANTSNAIDDGNGQSYNFYFWINAGTDYIGTPHANWGNQSDSGRAGTSTLGVGETVNDYFQLTGVQFEVGEYTSSTLPPFQHESFADNLERCRRYYEKSYAHDVAIGTNTYADQNFSDGDFTNQSNNEISHGFIYKTSKRSTPSITVYDYAGTSGKCNRWQFGVTTHGNESVQVDNQGAESCRIKSPNGNTAAIISYHYTANSEL